MQLADLFYYEKYERWDKQNQAKYANHRHWRQWKKRTLELSRKNAQVNIQKFAED